jgi:hypothetical protein
MQKSILLSNKSSKSVRVMLEPITFSEDIEPGNDLSIIKAFSEDRILIDITDEGISIWTDPYARFKQGI